MVKIYIVLAIFVLCLIGLAEMLFELRAILEQRNFAVEFHRKFVNLLDPTKSDFDSNLYAWLIAHSTQMQWYLGSLGRVHYKPAFSGYMVDQYQIVVNTLESIGMRTVNHVQIVACENAIIRKVGLVDQALVARRTELKNPVRWFKEGVQWLLALPLNLLLWFGIVTEDRIDNISHGPLFSFLSGVLALVGFLGSIVTLMLGWKQAKEIVMSIMK